MEVRLSNTVEINGTQLYYEQYKHPTSTHTIVCLHGFLASTFSFRKLLPLLRKSFNVVCIDWPPFGKSEKSKKFIYSYNNLAHTVITFIEKLHLEQITFLSHSMGGQITLRIAHLRPDLVQNMVLLCSSSYLKKSKLPGIVASYLPFAHIFVRRYLERSGLENNLRLVVHDISMIDEEMEKGYLEPFLQQDIYRALARMIRDREADLTKEELQEISTRTLLIWGKQDRVVPLHIGQQLAKDLPNAKLIILEETGHLVPEERPTEVMEYVMDFMGVAEPE